jgi:hypothetical protein
MATTQSEALRENEIVGNISSTPDRSIPTPAFNSTSKYTQREKLLTMLGVLLVMLLASLDQTNPHQVHSCLPAAAPTRTPAHISFSL